MKYFCLHTHDLTTDTAFFSKLYAQRNQAFLHLISALLDNDEELSSLLNKTDDELYMIGCARNLVMEILEFEVYDPKYVIAVTVKK